MKIPQTQVLSDQQALQLLEIAELKGWQIHYLREKHQLLLENATGWLAKLYLPWTQTWLPEGRFEQVEDVHYCITLVRAGQAAVGYFHRGTLLDHKVFRAYLVRQKQGMSQFKYLKTKGKSRAGSRIRLEETELFFKDINDRLQVYAQQYPLDFWGLGCAKTMWPLLFDGAVKPPFSSKSPELIELPYPFTKGSYEELQELELRLQQFHLLLSPLAEPLIQLQQADDPEADDSW
ncbi:MAG: hypothetical protein NBV61_01470 [Algoriphagus sp.]|nr:hypothetical protein [Algoriphagus sp.]